MSIRDTQVQVQESARDVVIGSMADVILSVTHDGTILDVWANDRRPLPESEGWVGRSLSDLLNTASQGQIIRARRHLSDGADAKARAQISLPLDNGRELPLAVQVVASHEGFRLVGLDQGPLVEAVSRADRLQVALESANDEDRTTKGLQRALLTHLGTAVALVDVTSGRVIDLSKPATEMLGISSDTLSANATGTAFTQCFEGRRRSEFIDSLCSAATSGRTITAELRAGRGEVVVRPELTRANGSIILVCRMAMAGDATGSERVNGFSALVAGSPDGMVCFDAKGVITHANQAFLQMVDASSEMMVVNRSIVPFLQRGTIDFKALVDPRRPETFNTQLVSLTNQRFAVEATVSGLPDGGFGLVLRDVSLANLTRGVPEVAQIPTGDIKSHADPARQVGTVPLRDIVAGMTDVIERDCIEAAIALTQNNRVAAAEMLGLSRQSLYVKLRKFGLLEKGDP